MKPNFARIARDLQSANWCCKTYFDIFRYKKGYMHCSDCPIEGCGGDSNLKKERVKEYFSQYLMADKLKALME